MRACCIWTTIAPHFLFTLLKAEKITPPGGEWSQKAEETVVVDAIVPGEHYLIHSFIIQGRRGQQPSFQLNELDLKGDRYGQDKEQAINAI